MTNIRSCVAFSIRKDIRSCKQCFFHSVKSVEEDRVNQWWIFTVFEWSTDTVGHAQISSIIVTYSLCYYLFVRRGWPARFSFRTETERVDCVVVGGPEFHLSHSSWYMSWPIQQRKGTCCILITPPRALCILNENAQRDDEEPNGISYDFALQTDGKDASRRTIFSQKHRESQSDRSTSVFPIYIKFP